jgi:exopolysaccharide biosynthesis polyprenyl glycosylphosphotransferase
MSKNLRLFLFVFFDYLSALLAWAIFFVYRKIYIEGFSNTELWIKGFNQQFYLGLFLIPIFWLLLYTITGTYTDIYRKSRLKELISTFSLVTIGVLVLFFVLLLDDKIVSHRTYYKLLFSLFFIHFTITFLFRIIQSTAIVKAIHNRKIGFNTLLVGSNQNALKLFHDMMAQKKSSGNLFQGFVHIENKNGKGHLLSHSLPHLGEIEDIQSIITNYKIEEVIIAIESWEHTYISNIIEKLQSLKVKVKVIPDMYDILSGSVKMSSIFGQPLIEISHDIMPYWQKFIKRSIDILLSIFALLLLTPVYILTSFIVKFTSKGTVFYSHERIGINGKPFTMYKFRSMYTDAEKNGPALSSKNDNRITPFGRFMRKSRLDEIPQFLNVLKGDMSIVGPRPERQFFINQICVKAPHYKLLHKIKPGITSWGQVKYGYAENVDEMIERLQYDLLYLENMSLIVDVKILIYTVLIVLQGRGK